MADENNVYYTADIEKPVVSNIAWNRTNVAAGQTVQKPKDFSKGMTIIAYIVYALFYGSVLLVVAMSIKKSFKVVFWTICIGISTPYNILAFVLALAFAIAFTGMFVKTYIDNKVSK